MIFDESVFSVGLFQKTIKGDQNVKLNHAYPRQKLLQKVPEDSRSHVIEVEGRRLPNPLGPPVRLRLAKSVLRCLKDCIFVVYSSRFDPRAQN